MRKKYLMLDNSHATFDSNTNEYTIDTSQLKITSDTDIYLVSQGVSKFGVYSSFKAGYNSFFTITAIELGVTKTLDINIEGIFDNGADLAAYLQTQIRNEANDRGLDAGWQTITVTYDTINKVLVWNLYALASTVTYPDDKTYINFRATNDRDPFTAQALGFTNSSRLTFSTASSGLVSKNSPYSTQYGLVQDIALWTLKTQFRQLGDFKYGNMKSTWYYQDLFEDYKPDTYNRNILIDELKEGDDLSELKLMFRDGLGNLLSGLKFEIVLVLSADEKGL